MPTALVKMISKQTDEVTVLSMWDLEDRGSRRHVIWKPPVTGSFKENVDAAFDKGVNCGFFGGGGA